MISSFFQSCQICANLLIPCAFGNAIVSCYTFHFTFFVFVFLFPGSFLDIAPETIVDADYQQCKRNFAVLHSVKNCVKSLIHRNGLMTRAVICTSSKQPNEPCEVCFSDPYIYVSHAIEHLDF